MSTAGPTTSSEGTETTGGSESSSEATGSEGGSDTGCSPISPPRVPECATCELTPACAFACDFTGCNTDCESDACGLDCVICGDERACQEAWSAGVCDGEGACVEDGTPEICDAGLQEGFEDELTVQSGCSDMVVYAHSADDTLGLSLYLTGLDVNGITEETEFTGIGYDAAQWLEVRVGTDVTAQECNDVVTPIVVDELWVPTAGTIDVVITPSGGGPLADVTLTDFVFEHAGASVSLPSYTFTDVLVGWFPG
jgi:hypothetical protein